MRCEKCGDRDTVVPGSVVCLLGDLSFVLCPECNRDFLRHAESHPCFQAWLDAARATDWVVWAQAHTDTGCTEMGKSEFIGAVRALHEAKITARSMVLAWIASGEE